MSAKTRFVCDAMYLHLNPHIVSYCMLLYFGFCWVQEAAQKKKEATVTATEQDAAARQARREARAAAVQASRANLSAHIGQTLGSAVAAATGRAQEMEGMKEAVLSSDWEQHRARIMANTQVGRLK